MIAPAKKARTDGKRIGPGGLRRGNEMCPCGRKATHDKEGPRCDTCREIEERLGRDFTNRNGGHRGYNGDPYHVLAPVEGLTIGLA